MKTILLPSILLASLVSVALAGQPALPVQTAPPLTDVEALRADNARLRAMLLERERQQLLADVARLKASIEAARPGWTWDPDSGRFTKKPEDPPKEQ